MAGDGFDFLARNARRIGITILGCILLIVGVALSLPGIPGPGILVVIAGLSVLAREYTWARRALDDVKRRAKGAREKLRKRRRDR